MKKLNEILGTKYPFIQGGMANIATGAVSYTHLEQRRLPRLFEAQQSSAQHQQRRREQIRDRGCLLYTSRCV